MTEKQAYESILRETRKAKAPSLRLDDYNYWMNKGVQEYINERYALYAVSQQLTDDLQAISTSAVLNVVETAPFTYVGNYAGGFTQPSVPISYGSKYGSNFIKFSLPSNYWHMKAVHTTAQVKFPYKCYGLGYTTTLPSKAITPDIAVGISNNSYLKPSIERFYHDFSDGFGANVKPDLSVYGDLSKISFTGVVIDYFKEPAKIDLTLQQRDNPIDNSAVLEFPEYVCNEIIKRVVRLVLEATSDPRLQSHIPINKTIQ